MNKYFSFMRLQAFSKACVTALLLLNAVSVWSIELPAGFIDELYIGDIEGQVTGFDWAGNENKVFIALKSGLVRVAVDGILLDEAFIDISEKVNDRVDRGLLSVAVHPEFPKFPYLYLLYTYDPPELQEFSYIGSGAPDGNGNRVARLDRYTADVNAGYNRVLEGSLKILMGTNSTFEQIGDPEAGYETLKPSCGGIDNPVRDCLPIDEMSHTIGAVRFAKDGSLYVTNGDGASYHDVAPYTVMVQDLDSMRGKVLRIDPETGQGLADNPFYDGDPDSNRSKVLNFGLRNPYSLAIHPQSGVPYVGEVGWDLWEEVNGGIAKNFAWPCYSGAEGGNVRRPDFEELEFCKEFYTSDVAIEAPVLAWPRNDAGAAMVGDFYFAESFPDRYKGHLFYADFLQGWIRYADLSDLNNVKKYDFASDVLPLVELKLGDDGALYYASITTGEIRRIRYAENTVNNNPPTPVIFTSGSSGTAPLEVTFDASNSSDSDGDIVAWRWDFGNGSVSDKEQETVTYANKGEYTVLLTVTDNLGESATAQTIISVEGNNISLTIEELGLASRYSIGDKISLRGFATQDGERVDNISLQWIANIYDGENAITAFASSENASIEFTYPQHSDSERVQVCLGAKVANSQVCELLDVNTVTLELDTHPTGQALVYNAIEVQTPFVQIVPMGAVRDVSVAASIAELAFVRWSDGGQRSHSITLQESTRLVANFAGSAEQFDYASAVSQEPSAMCLESGVCWRFFSNLNGDVFDETSYVSLLFADGRYSSAADASSLYLGKATSHSGQGVSDGVVSAEYAIARFVLEIAGDYAIVDSYIHDQNSICGDGMDVLILLNTEQIHSVPVSNGGQVEFNHQLGPLQRGDMVAVTLGPDASSECDTFSWRFGLQRKLSGEVAPVFQTLPESPQISSVGEAISISILATDANGDTVSYTSKDLPIGLELNSQSGLLSGQIDASGTYTSVIIASDGKLSTEHRVVWKVDGGSKSSRGALHALLLVLAAFLLLRPLAEIATRTRSLL